MEQQIIQFAPIIFVVFLTFIQYRLFVTPAELEKKHREILKDVEAKFVTLTAFNAFKEQVNKIDKNVSMLCEHLMKERGE